MTKEVLKLALETLEGLFGTPLHVHQGGAVAVWRLGGSDAPRRTITAIKEALAQQEPFAPDWVNYRQGKIDGAREATTETGQDIATLEKNIALMRDEELRVCVKEFFEKYLNRTEESSGGKMFNPIVVSCCRAMMTEPLNNLLSRMAELSGAKPKEIYD